MTSSDEASATVSASWISSPHSTYSIIPVSFMFPLFCFPANSLAWACATNKVSKEIVNQKQVLFFPSESRFLHQRSNSRCVVIDCRRVCRLGQRGYASSPSLRMGHSQTDCFLHNGISCRGLLDVLDLLEHTLFGRSNDVSAFLTYDGA